MDNDIVQMLLPPACLAAPDQYCFQYNLTHEHAGVGHKTYTGRYATPGMNRVARCLNSSIGSTTSNHDSCPLASLFLYSCLTEPPVPFPNLGAHDTASPSPSPPPPTRSPLPTRSTVADLDLLRAPAELRLPHVGGGLDGGDELEGGVADADEADDGAGDDAQDVAVEEDAADEDVEGAAADEGEEEGGVAGHLGRDLELEEAGGWFAAPRVRDRSGVCV